MVMGNTIEMVYYSADQYPYFPHFTPGGKVNAATGDVIKVGIDNDISGFIEFLFTCSVGPPYLAHA